MCEMSDEELVEWLRKVASAKWMVDLADRIEGELRKRRLTTINEDAHGHV